MTTTVTMGITPGNKVVRETIVNQIRDLVRDVDMFKDIHVVSEHTELKKSNKGIYVAVKGRNKVSTGIDNYGGVERGYAMLTKIASASVPGNSIEWVSVDERAYDTTQAGTYFIVLTDANTFAYLYVPERCEEIYKRYDGVSNVFNLAEEPIDKDTVHVYANDYSLIRGQDFEVDGTEVTMIKAIPEGLRVTAKYLIDGGTVENIPYERNRFVDIIPGIRLNFADRPFVGDEMALVLHPEPRPVYHVFSSRADMNVSLMLSVGDKKFEDRIVDFLFPRIDLEMRNWFQNIGWSMTELSYSDEDREEWDEGGELTVSNSTITMTLNVEWARFIPLVREFTNLITSNSAFLIKRGPGIGLSEEEEECP